MSEKWKKWRKHWLLSLVLLGSLAAFGSGYFYGSVGALVALVSILCMALGFWVLENLVGVLTGVKKANPAAIALLVTAKLLWWLGIFWASRAYPKGHEIPVALGLGAFLLSLLAASLSQYGWPKISDAKVPGEP